MADHTPGPWEAAKIYVNKSDGSSDTHIATAATHDVSEVEACANARLIAAAPELLAAAKAFAENAVETADGNIVFGYRVLDRLRAAIAKAEGR